MQQPHVCQFLTRIGKPSRPRDAAPGTPVFSWLALCLLTVAAGLHVGPAVGGESSGSLVMTIGSAPVQEQSAAEPIILSQGPGDILRGPGGVIGHALKCGTIGDVGLDRCEEGEEEASSPSSKPQPPPPLDLLEPQSADRTDAESEDSGEPDSADRDEAANRAEEDSAPAADEEAGSGKIGARAKRFADGGLLIYMLTEDSPAHEAGLKAGDEIVAIDGTEIEGIPDEEVRALFRGSVGKEIEVEVRRGGELKRLVMRRADLPDGAQPLLGAKVTEGLFADLDLSERQQFAIGAIQEWRARETERIREIAESRVAEFLSPEQQQRLQAFQDESAGRIEEFFESLKRDSQTGGLAESRRSD